MSPFRVFCALSLGVLAACGGQQPQPQTGSAPAEAAPAPAASDAPAAEASPSDAPAPTASASAAPAPAAPPPPISALCEKMCDAQAAKCSADKVKACKQNYCSRYGGAPEVCEPAVRMALA